MHRSGLVCLVFLPPFLVLLSLHRLCLKQIVDTFFFSKFTLSCSVTFLFVAVNFWTVFALKMIVFTILLRVSAKLAWWWFLSDLLPSLFPLQGTLPVLFQASFLLFDQNMRRWSFFVPRFGACVLFYMIWLRLCLIRTFSFGKTPFELSTPAATIFWHHQPTERCPQSFKITLRLWGSGISPLWITS